MGIKTLATLLGVIAGILVLHAGARAAAIDFTQQPVVVHTGDAAAFRAGGAADELLRRARQAGELPIMVELRITLRPESALSPTAFAAQQLSLSTLTDRVAARAFGGDRSKIDRHIYVPFFGAFATEAQIRKLLADPDVVSIAQDVILVPQLDYSITTTHADDIYAKGANGAGQVVAIMDSGVARHPDFNGKVVSEACYSTQQPSAGFTSFCPGQHSSSTAPGSGVNCPPSVRGCDHGTHVASIAAGGGAHPGIAKGAKIIAIQIFSRLQGSGCSQVGQPSPCAVFRGNDVVRGLERVLQLKGTFKIAAVNMSFGSGAYSQACDDSAPAIAKAIDDIRLADIAPVAASGNSGFLGKIGMPACMSAAISVGNTMKGDADNLERVNLTSNHSEQIDLMAPGTNINAALLGNGYGPKTGTSMAAPHVVGAFAVMKQAKPSASVEDVLEALECSGKTVVRPFGTGIAKPRIDLLGAYNFLKVPNARRQWAFDQNEEGLDWTPYLGTWHVNAGEYAPDSIPDGAVFSSTANCNRKLDVTVTIKRTYAAGGPSDPETYPNAGIVLKSKLDYKTHTMSGYFFGYNYFPRGTDPDKGWGFIQRIENNSQTKVICWETENVPINYNTWNTLRAVSIGGIHTLYLNGKRICSGTDTTFKYGPVAALTGFSTSYTTTAGKFSISQLSIRGIDTIEDSKASASAADAVAASPAFGMPPVRMLDGGLLASRQ